MPKLGSKSRGDGAARPFLWERTGVKSHGLSRELHRLNNCLMTSFIGWLSCWAVVSLGGAGGAGSAGVASVGAAWVGASAGEVRLGMLR